MHASNAMPCILHGAHMENVAIFFRLRHLFFHLAVGIGRAFFRVPRSFALCLLINV